ncbi:NAD(P)/FAD-dependent oxidoreductase [Lacipirellula limnantheis]|uniref:Oxidoreductase n=1 Tax=Lacipirellula limnantheis TaxID=2528024 RepID=A0A517U0C4_9BACT|nr:NAD(P)/FAD-dependent oxidoreductase [Lacipirellula limnantheis]QDT74088.1 Putative oxidoreductase [Lacipirellula limnantheis]
MSHCTIEKSPKELQESYDCIVMGAGPSGSTTATLVAKAGFNVLLVERERFPRRHVGESLMPDIYFTFEKLGILDKLKQSGYAKKVGVQFVNHAGRESAPFLFRWNDPNEWSETWHIPRPEFDQMMFDTAAENGVDAMQGVRVLEVLFEGERAVGVKLQFNSDDGATETREVRAKVVVDATGQSAILSNKLGLRRVNPDLKKAAVWGHFKGAKRDTEHGGVYTIVLHTNQRKSWFWYIPQADDVVSIGVVGDNDYMLKGRGTPSEIFFQEVDKCPAVKGRMEGATQVDELIVTKEFSYLTDRSAGDGWVLVGDAWGFIDPVYSSGVFFALKSGELASECIIDALQANDPSEERLGKWLPGFKEKTNWVRKLVHAFYSGGFRVGKFVKEFPHHRGELTDLLVGRVFNDRVGGIFKDLDPFMERMKNELPPEDPNAEPEDADVPALA